MSPPTFFDPSPFASLLPSGIPVVATRAEIEEPLFAVEESVLRSAVESRRREFVTGRICAREALARLGLPRQAIPADQAGAPRWPRGVVGSITHCDGLRAAAVGLAADFAAVAIDAEPDRPLPAGVLGAVALPVERERVNRLLREAPGPSWDRLLFSAKEAVFKAWHPMTGTRLRYEDAEIVLRAESGEFAVHLRVPHSPGETRHGLCGRWAVASGVLATAMALPATGG